MIQDARLNIFQISSGNSINSFSQDVLAGLTSSPKQLPPRYFYDELGARLFEAICYLPEYYLTRDESEILEGRADEIVAESGVTPQSEVNLIEFGSGSSDKTRYLIEALLRRGVSLSYTPIDVSLSSLENSSAELLKAYPGININAYAADYFSALKELAGRKNAPEETDRKRNVAIFLGSSIGNLDFNESCAFLRAMREVLKEEDSFFIGADLRKSADILIPAYNDALGVTAAFNLNLLVRINRELGGDFELSKFEHGAIFNEELSRIEMHLFSREEQSVNINGLDLNVHFAKGESIHTENSYKFEISTLSRLAEETGFRLTKTWFDGNRRFSFNLFTAVKKE